MNIVVLNGSPKGTVSVTMHFVEYLGIIMPDARLTYCNVAKEIRGVEGRAGKMEEIAGHIREADLVLFAYPVYYMTVPSQYMRFMELLFETEAHEVFRGKAAAVITTSIHFFDHTSHEYMRAVIDKLQMDYMGGFSAHMEDLTTEEGRKKLQGFAGRIERATRDGSRHPRRYTRHSAPGTGFTGQDRTPSLDNGTRSVVIFADKTRDDSNLPAMIRRFGSNFMVKPRVVWLESLNLISGCTGCLACAMDLRCVFTEKDGHREIVDSVLTKSDIVVFASDVEHCYLTSRWQAFLTRLFFNGHVPLVQGRQMGVILSGPLSDYPYIREVFDGFMGYSQNNLFDFVTDENPDHEGIEADLDNMAAELLSASEAGYIQPRRFQALCAHKVFRDEIFGSLGVVFQHDHQYFARNKLYDFPTGRLGRRMVNALLYMLLKTPGLRKRFYTKEMVPGMVRPYKKILERARKNT